MGAPVDGSDVDELVESLLGRRLGPLEPLGAGTDHVAYGVEDLVVRVPRGDRETGEREVRLLAHLAPMLDGLVPQVLAEDVATGVVVMSRVPGVALLDAPGAPDALVDGLVRLLLTLHDATAEVVERDLAGPDPYPLPAYVEEALGTLSEVAHVLPAGAGNRLERFLSQPPPPESELAVLAHNDLGAEHLFVDPETRRLAGVIDWADAAVVDPARDLGRLHRDLGPAVTGRIVAALPYRDDPHLGDRIRLHAVCSLVEDLAYGLAEDERYARAALANLERTLEDGGR